ncbi:type VII secretion target [Rhodococcus sp. NPDC047139]|uniref:type VII secretion target n=1 Tax=Rhodococcus sp. NPDC047139 TaxID=3155141 RepID=UPI0033CA96EE
MSGLFHDARIRVVPDGIRAFGATNLRAAEHVAQAGALDLQANISALSPALGVIGGEFLAAFAAAQSEHTHAVARLSAAYASNGAAALEAAAGYETADTGTASALAYAAEGL